MPAVDKCEATEDDGSLTGQFTWIIENFNKLKQPKLYSPVFQSAQYNWYRLHRGREGQRSPTILTEWPQPSLLRAGASCCFRAATTSRSFQSTSMSQIQQLSRKAGRGKPTSL
jgi:hypothetical protein